MNGFSPQSHLLLVILTPLIGAVVAWLLGGRGLSAVRQSAAVTSLATLGLAGWLVLRFLGDEAAMAGIPYARIEFPWLTGGLFDVRLALGLDGLSLEEMQAVEPRIDAGVMAVLSVDASVASRTSLGGTAPANVAAAAAQARRRFLS